MINCARAHKAAENSALNCSDSSGEFVFSGAATPNVSDAAKRPLAQQAVAGEQWGAENSTAPVLHQECCERARLHQIYKDRDSE